MDGRRRKEWGGFLFTESGLDGDGFVDHTATRFHSPPVVLITPQTPSSGAYPSLVKGRRRHIGRETRGRSGPPGTVANGTVRALPTPHDDGDPPDAGGTGSKVAVHSTPSLPISLLTPEVTRLGTGGGRDLVHVLRVGVGVCVVALRCGDRLDVVLEEGGPLGLLGVGQRVSILRPRPAEPGTSPASRLWPTRPGVPLP